MFICLNDSISKKLIEIVDEIHAEKKHNEETLEKQRSKIWLRYRLTHDFSQPPEYTFHEISLAKIDLFLEAKSKEENPITWFKWLPDMNCNGAASIQFLKSENVVDLKFHVADQDNLMKNYVLDEDVSNYLKLMKFIFQNFLETNMRLSVLYEINKNNDFFQVWIIFYLTT